MSSNRNGMGGAKGFLLAHGEKLGVALLVAIAGWFVYSASGYQSLPENYQASNLNELVRKTKSSLASYTWSSVPETDKLLATSVTEVKSQEIALAPYKVTQFAWNRPVVLPMKRRADPVLLPAFDLQVSSGAGLLAYYDERALAEKKLKIAAEQEKTRDDENKIREREGRDAERGSRRGRRGGDLENNRDRNRDPSIREANGNFMQEGVITTGEEEVIVKHWATVVAKVPVGEQKKIYKKAFEKSLGYNDTLDYPVYNEFRIQRTEVDSKGKELGWKTITPASITGQPYLRQGKRVSQFSPRAIRKITESWVRSDTQNQGAGVLRVDEEYSHMLLTGELPPLVSQAWDKKINHTEIPYAKTEAELRREEEEKNKADAAKNEDNEDYEGDSGFERGGYAQGRGGEMIGRGMGRPGGEMIGRGMGRPGGEMIGRGMGSPGRTMGRRGGSFSADGEAPRFKKDFVLFRFFDFSVKPGKKYKYRVQLVMEDVNAASRVLLQYLDKEAAERVSPIRARLKAIAKKNRRNRPGTANAYAFGSRSKPIPRSGPWSDPSPMIGIPHEGDAFLAAVNPVLTKDPSSEPKVTLLVESFGIDDDARAMKISKEQEFFRGSVLNMVADSEYLINNGREIKKKTKFPFQTAITLLDAKNGKKIGYLKTPTSALLMDSAGRLFVRQEMQDKEHVEKYRAIFAEDKRRRNGRGGRDAFDGQGSRGGLRDPGGVMGRGMDEGRRGGR